MQSKLGAAALENLMALIKNAANNVSQSDSNTHLLRISLSLSLCVCVCVG